MKRWQEKNERNFTRHLFLLKKWVIAELLARLKDGLQDEATPYDR